MFFETSKIFWFLAAPSSIIGFLLTTAAVLHFTRYRRTARVLSVVVAAAYFAGAVMPLGTALMQTLENRFPHLPAEMPPPDGIIVLGGGVEEVISAERDLAQLTYSGTRMTQGAMLARRYPSAKLVFSGGSGRLTPGTATEADVARRFFADEGLSPDRIFLEERSRNTWENAVFTRDLVQPKPGERWLLVTSAAHMPRSVGIFRKVGFDVIPWPADYMTRPGPPPLRPNRLFSEGLQMTDRAVREYAGLLAYFLAGRTSSLFPDN